MQAQRGETNHLNNHITTPERTRPTEEEIEDEMTTSTEPENTETDHEESGFEQESENTFWNETDSSAEISDLDEIRIEEHRTKEKKEKQFQSKLGKKKGIMLASWIIRGKSDSTHNSKWPRIARIMRLKRIAILAIQEARIRQYMLHMTISFG